MFLITSGSLCASSRRRSRNEISFKVICLVSCALGLAERRRNSHSTNLRTSVHQQVRSVQHVRRVRTTRPVRYEKSVVGKYNLMYRNKKDESRSYGVQKIVEGNISTQLSPNSSTGTCCCNIVRDLHHSLMKTQVQAVISVTSDDESIPEEPIKSRIPGLVERSIGTDSMRRRKRKVHRHSEGSHRITEQEMSKISRRPAEETADGNAFDETDDRTRSKCQNPDE